MKVDALNKKKNIQANCLILEKILLMLRPLNLYCAAGEESNANQLGSECHSLLLVQPEKMWTTMENMFL